MASFIRDDGCRSRGFPILIGVALMAHIFVLFLDSNHTSNDTPTYVIPAQALLRGEGFVDARGLPETRRTPGYPLFLSVFYALHLGDTGILIVQHSIAVLMVAFLYRWTCKITGDCHAALVAGWILLLDIPSLVHPNLILTETLFTLTVWSIVTLMGSGERQEPSIPRLGMAGLLSAVSTLIRPISLFYAPLLALWFLACAWMRRLKASSQNKYIPLLGAVILLGVNALPLGLWAKHNQHQTGVFAIHSIAGDNMLFYKAAGALAMEDPGDYAANFERHKKELKMLADARIEEETGVPAASLHLAKRSPYYEKLGIELLLSHPIGTIKIAIYGLAGILLGGSTEAVHRWTGLPTNVIRPVVALWQILVMVLMLVGIRRLYKKMPCITTLLLLTCGYFIVLPLGGEAYSRFRVPVMPYIAFFAGHGYAALKSWRQMTGMWAKRDDAGSDTVAFHG